MYHVANVSNRLIGFVKIVKIKTVNITNVFKKYIFFLKLFLSVPFWW